MDMLQSDTPIECENPNTSTP